MITRMQITIYRTEDICQVVILTNKGEGGLKEEEITGLSGFLAVIDMGFTTRGGTCRRPDLVSG